MTNEDQNAEACIPRPVGWKLLVRFLKVDDKFSNSSLVKPDSTRRAEELQMQIGQVVDMGTLCYTDTTKFSTGPWCKVGDYIMFNYVSGRRFKLGPYEFRLLNDDQVEATVEDPKLAAMYMRGI